MATFNPYAIDPALSASISNLTRALIGSAEDDAALARARASDASARASDAAAGASNALAAQRAEQTRRLRELGTIAAETNPALASAIARSLGLDVTVDPLGNIIQPVAPDGPQMSVPVQTGSGDLMTLDNSGIQSLSNAFFGNLEYRPDQFAAGLDTLGAAGNSRLAESMILGGTNDEAARGALLLAPQGGQYQNPGFAMSELETNAGVDRYRIDRDYDASIYATNQDLAARRAVATIAADADIAVAEINAETTITTTNLDNTSREAIAAADREAQTGWETYKANSVAETEMAIAGITDARERQLAADELARLQSNDINDQFVVNGDVLITSPELGQRLGLNQITIGTGDQAQTVYGYDGRISARTSKMPVILEGLQQGDDPVIIYVEAKDLENSNAVNRNGQFVVPDGMPLYRTTDTAATREFGSAEQNQVAAAIQQTMEGVGYENVPERVKNAIQTELLDASATDFQRTNNISAATGSAQRRINETFGGSPLVTINPPGMNNEFDVPAFIINDLMPFTERDDVDAAVREAQALIQRYAFDTTQTNAILNFIAQQ